LVKLSRYHKIILRQKDRVIKTTMLLLDYLHVCLPYSFRAFPTNCQILTINLESIGLGNTPGLILILY
jgi:hypothetical protein